MALMILIARLILGAIFLVAGAAKLFDREGSRASAKDFGVPRVLAPLVALLLPVAELSCAVLLLVPSLAAYGAMGAAALLVAFSAGIAITLARGRKPACHCFGQLSSSPIGWSTLGRNAALLIGASLVIWMNDVAIAVNPAPATADTVMLLALALLLQTVLGATGLFYLLRQNGKVMLRLEAVEAKLGLVEAPEPINTGLPVGSAAPSFDLRDLDGQRVSLARLQTADRPVVLIFSEPGCASCEALLPELAQWQQEHATAVQFVLVSRDSVEANREKMAGLFIAPVLLQKNREVAEAYGVVGTPSAVLVEDGRIASSLSAGAEAIRALVKRASAPQPLKRGDRVPAMPMRALDGGTMDLATLTGRRTVLLFWNPGCGYCQAMLDDVRAWERERPAAAPALVVVSAGSPSANREQGFRSPVLLDPKFAASERFGIPGTPAAVVIDAEGRVASDAGIGAPAVRSILGAGSPQTVTR